MLIIIEGVDRTGKSTLAEELVRITDGTLIHSSKPEGDPLDEYVGRLKDYTPGNGQHMVLDRWHLGELVWPTIFKRASEYDDDAFKLTDAFLKNRGALIVYAERKDHEVWAEELVLHNEPIDGATGAEARDLFENALARTTCHIVRYNFQTVKLEDAADAIVTHARKLEAQAS